MCLPTQRRGTPPITFVVVPMFQNSVTSEPRKPFRRLSIEDSDSSIKDSSVVGTRHGEIKRISSPEKNVGLHPKAIEFLNCKRDSGLKRLKRHSDIHLKQVHQQAFQILA